MLRKIARFLLRAHTLRVELDAGNSTIGTVTNVTCMMSRTKNMSFPMPLHGNVLFEKAFCKTFC